MSTEVTTSATTSDLPHAVERPGVQVIYPDRSEQVSYTVQAHPPTPRDQH